MASTNQSRKRPSTTSNRNTGRKKNTNSKNSNNAKTNTRSKASKDVVEDVDPGIKQEAILVLLLFAVLFLFLCMVNLVGGGVGPFIKQLILGIFGILGFLVPILLGLAVVFKMVNKNNHTATLRLICFIVLFSMIGVLLAHFNGGHISDLAKDSNVFAELYNMQKGGGVLFGIIAVLFYKIFGNAGSIFIAVALIVVSLIIITGKSLKRWISERMNGEDDWDEGDYAEEDYPVTPVKEKSKKKKAASIDINISEDMDGQGVMNPLPVRTSAKEDATKVSDVEPVKETNHIKGISNSVFDDDVISTPAIKRGDIHEITLKNIDDTSIPISNSGHFDNDAINRSGIASDSEILSASVVVEETKAIVKTVEPVAGSVDMTPTDEMIIPSVPVSTPSSTPTTTQDIPVKEVLSEKPVVEDRVVPSDTAEIDKSRIENMVTPVTERTHSANEKNAPAGDITQKPVPKPRKPYKKPPVDLLSKGSTGNKGDSDVELKKTAVKLEDTLKVFGVDASVSDICQGPSVTRFEVTLAEGVKVNKIVSLTDDLKLRLAAQDIRMEAPIPGKSAVGIEIPNKNPSGVCFRDLIESKKYKASDSNLTFAVGKDISGDTIIADIAKMPHMLIAGATGAGKSVCINTLIMSLLYKSSPEDVKLIMIDPKVVELSVYNGIPHLLLPVVTDPRKASAALAWAVNEMTKRYNAFANHEVRDLKGFNEKAMKNPSLGLAKMPQIVVIVDELADLMMVASKEVEESICRLAQLARAAGIHLIIATQRPSVDVITGLIKANMPSRVAFKVSSGVDSRTILDSNGAEKLLGKGDMLFYPQGMSKPLRVQGAFISDSEVAGIVKFLRDNSSEEYDNSIENEINSLSGGNKSSSEGSSSSGDEDEDMYDEYFEKACRLVVEKEKASSGMLQRVYKIGFNRAARIIDQMEGAGIVGPEEGTKPRRVLVDEYGLNEILNQIKGL